MSLSGCALDAVIGTVVAGRPHASAELITVLGRRRVLIDLTAAEASALECAVIDDEQPRPMPYQFIVALLAMTEERVQQVHIARFADAMLRADVLLTNGATVNARPGDALNVAVLTGAAIVVDSVLLQDRS